MTIDLVSEPPVVAMLVTIVGFSPEDSGKTRLAARLARGLRDRGVKVRVAKPLGGHNLWTQHFSIRYTLDHGVLVGGDAVRLARVIGSEPHLIEPVDVLLAPPDVERFLSRLRDYLILLGSFEAQAVLLRVNACSGERIEWVHLMVEDNVATLPPSLRSVVEEIASTLKPSPLRISSARLHEMIANGDLVLAADVCTARVLGDSEVGIIESYNDILVPVPTALRSTYFIAVGPGRAVVYRGGDVAKAATLYASFRPGTTRTSEVLHLVKPRASIPVEFTYDDESMGADIEKLVDLVLERGGEG